MRHLLLALLGLSVCLPAQSIKLPGGNEVPVKIGTGNQSSPAGNVKTVRDPIDGRYIVVLKQSPSQKLIGALLGPLGLKPDLIFEQVLNGFAVAMTPDQAKRLAGDSRVRYVEQDAWVKKSAPPWGLDRIDQTNLPLDQEYTPAGDGAGVHAYIIDTGIRSSHREFKGRMGQGYNVAGGSDGLANLLFNVPVLGPMFGGGNNGDPDNTEDCNGHGTHVAGTVGGTQYGVAPKVTLYPIRVLNCEGSGAMSGVIEGVDWVTKNHKSPAVVNMSLGGGRADSLDEAVRNSIKAGITYVVAAGNDDADACGSSPARTDEAITVGSTTKSDARSSFSNKGRCLDIFAPGSDINSAWHTGDTASNTISGTSMAAPHVAGVAALFLGKTPDASPAEVAAALREAAVTGKVSDPASGSPNRLLQLTKAADAPNDDVGRADPPASPPATGGPDKPDDGGDTPAESPAAAQPMTALASCNALRCDFRSHLPESASVRWQLGDGMTAQGHRAAHIYDEFRSYTVKVEAEAGEQRWAGQFPLKLGSASAKACDTCLAVQGHIRASDSVELGAEPFSTQQTRDMFAWLKTQEQTQALVYLDRQDNGEWTMLSRSLGDDEDQALALSDAPAGRYRFRLVSGDQGGDFRAWAGSRAAD